MTAVREPQSSLARPIGIGRLTVKNRIVATAHVCQHVHPGMGRQAADRFAALLRG